MTMDKKPFEDISPSKTRCLVIVMLVFGDTATMNPEAAGYVTVTKDRRCQVWARTNRVSCVLLFVCVCVCVIVSSRTFLRTTICNNKGLITVKKTRYGIDNFSF